LGGVFRLLTASRWSRFALLILDVICLRGQNAVAAPPDAGWVQIGEDEFDGTATHSNQYGLDLDKWTTCLPWFNEGLNDRWFGTANTLFYRPCVEYTQ
jgi:hypothetical protein